jgi:hypothetical protein
MMQDSWPTLDTTRDGATIAALHLFSQIAGKGAVAVAPWRNHGWHATLHLSARGLATEPLHLPGAMVTVGLDLIDHCLVVDVSTGKRWQFPFEATSLADAYQGVSAAVADTCHQAAINGRTNEIEPAVEFAAETEPRPYSRDSASRLLAALRHADRLLRLFRSGFLGKASPVHFFWGSFDLAVTRFSGREAPLHPGGIPHLPDRITREAYSHEVSSAGFWPGGAAGGTPLFYSYAYPEPAGFAAQPIQPASARYDPDLKEFVLEYADARAAADPDQAVLAFLQSTYAGAAELGVWDRTALECRQGVPRVPRTVAGA